MPEWVQRRQGEYVFDAGPLRLYVDVLSRDVTVRSEAIPVQVRFTVAEAMELGDSWLKQVHDALVAYHASKLTWVRVGDHEELKVGGLLLQARRRGWTAHTGTGRCLDGSMTPSIETSRVEALAFASTVLGVQLQATAPVG